MYDFNEWFAKTKKYDIYKKQKKEVVKDIEKLGRTYLDVACGQGRILEALTKKEKEVEGLDINYNKVDILEDAWPKKKFDVVFTSLSIIVFNEKDVNEIIEKMSKQTKKYLYFFEELLPDKTCGEQVGDQKWAHDMTKHLKDFKLIYNIASPLNKVWRRYLYTI